MQTWPEGAPLNPTFYFPPGPPALSATTSNPNPPSWSYRPPNASGTNRPRPSRGPPAQVYVRNGVPPPGPPQFSDEKSSPNQSRNGSGTGSGSHPSLSHGSAQMYVRNAGHTHPDLVEGLDYFKIGDVVRIRRWNAAQDAFSEWNTGQVVRPRLTENDDGSHRRSYVVSYKHGDKTKEREFSPYFQEIASLEGDPTPVIPNLRLGDNMQIVFAPINVKDSAGQKRVVYTQAQVLTAPNEHGCVRLRILAGPSMNHEMSDFSVKHAQPCNAQSAQMLRQQGFLVEGNGTASTIRFGKPKSSTYVTHPM
ncbi:hypothetical protein DFH07DRAFT_1065077 [Mycena maculata]|uniref:Uncharacterized protein n=1 Tax=Mycena maculata TaxID=230809 RepID=A0AAD7MXL6_9AGAR|nr:hypothetical protein DFH07DRAFT_1065077 [Mycena maculata]